MSHSRKYMPHDRQAGSGKPEQHGQHRPRERRETETKPERDAGEHDGETREGS